MESQTRLERVSTLARIFGGARTLEEVCRAFVLDPIWNGGLLGNQFHSLTSRGTLVSVASFGVEAVPETQKLTLFDEHTVSLAARTKEIQVIDYPENSEWLLWTMPLLKDDLAAGTMSSVTKKNVKIEKFSDEEKKTVGNLAYLFLSASGVPEIVKDKEVAATGQLSDRQYEILLYMAKGKTNAEIAEILILSESSIKQESVKIFKALGVGNRQDAVKRAKASGTIPSQEI